MIIGFERGSHNFKENVVLLMVQTKFPGSEINFPANTMKLSTNGTDPAVVKNEILKIPGIRSIVWFD